MPEPLIIIDTSILEQIHRNGEAAYPNEGAGLMLGTAQGETRQVKAILNLPNSREESAQRRRYLLTPQDYARGEAEADRLGLDVIGVFHSHPDHPNRPSEYDREWAMPWFSYLITSVMSGSAVESRSWQLKEDRSTFIEENLQVSEGEGNVTLFRTPPAQP